MNWALIALLALAGCARSMRPVQPAVPMGAGMLPPTGPSALAAMAVRSAVVVPTPATNGPLRVEWDWVPAGPVVFPVWSSTNLVTWTFCSNCWASPVLITKGPRAQFFRVGASNYNNGLVSWKP